MSTFLSCVTVMRVFFFFFFDAKTFQTAALVWTLRFKKHNTISEAAAEGAIVQLQAPQSVSWVKEPESPAGSQGASDWTRNHLQPPAELQG